ncbi:MAG: FmdB family zinc ribbon protein [Candidatus Omnitrophota bacterium]
MSTYVYFCNKCKQEREVIHSILETIDKKTWPCPKCGSPMKRLISSGVGFKFEGSGTYHTDYRLLGGSGYSSKGKQTKGGIEVKSGKKKSI